MKRPTLDLSSKFMAAEAIRSESRLLLIDDDPAYVFLCKRYLHADEHFKHTVISASSFTEALSVCTVDEFDCFIVDYCLPDKLGTDALTEFREILGHAMPPAIIFTVDGGEVAAIDAVRSGAADFLAKRDVNQHSLRRAVRNAVQKGMLMRSLLGRVADLEEANEKLRKRNSEIQRFYHTVSHEVKTPLTAIQEFVSIVHDGIAGELEEEQKTILQYALQSCDQIARQFSDLLELSRFETGKMSVKLVPSSLNGVLDHCVVAATPAALEKNITLSVNEDEALPIVLMESSRIIQVVSNLLNNAIKFTHPGGSVSLRCDLVESGSAVKMSVRDTGVGIPKKHLRHIFDRLYQVTPSSDLRDTGGMGLGLSIASEIIELHGGRIEVESTVGKGSTFSFLLKCETEDCAAVVA